VVSYYDLSKNHRFNDKCFFFLTFDLSPISWESHMSKEMGITQGWGSVRAGEGAALAEGHLNHSRIGDKIRTEY
jgi:hypothetical protein